MRAGLVLAGSVIAGVTAVAVTGCSAARPQAGADGHPTTRSAPASGSSGPGSSGHGSSGSGPSGSRVPVSSPPPTAASGAPLPQPGPVTETAGSCPYLDAVTASDLEGNKVGRVTVVSTDPVGCNFYFAYADGHMTLQISTQRYATATDAYNAMVATGDAGAQVEGIPGLVPGVDAVLYRTSFYPPDKGRDWACSFATGPVMVTVKTDQTDISFNARNIAATIAPKF